VDISANPECKLVLLDKGGLLPIEGSTYHLGLGWDPAVSGAPMDLDVGVVLLDKDDIYVDFVYFHQQSSSGVQHSGDNRTGHGDGDDEWIKFDLSKLDSTVESLVVVVSAYQGSFMAVRNAFCRLVDEAEGREIARWELSGMFEATSLVVCKVYRDCGWWKLFVIGEPIGGRSIVEFFFTDTYGDMAELRDGSVETCPRRASRRGPEDSLQVRAQSFVSNRREQFKRVARIQYSDATFFKVCAERAEYGQLSATKS